MPIHNTDWVQVVQPLLCRVTSSSKISCSSEANSSELITKARYFYTTQWITVRSNWREMWSRLVWSGGGSSCGGSIITGFSIWWAQSSSCIYFMFPLFKLVQNVHNLCVFLFVLHDDRHGDDFWLSYYRLRPLSRPPLGVMKWEELWNASVSRDDWYILLKCPPPPGKGASILLCIGMTK